MIALYIFGYLLCAFVIYVIMPGSDRLTSGEVIALFLLWPGILLSGFLSLCFSLLGQLKYWDFFAWLRETRDYIREKLGLE